MSTVQSADGTLIAYDAVGSGPALVLVDGALCTRAIGPSKGLARFLSQRFTAITYDRRGRGDSGDSPEFRVEREVEDLEALIAATEAALLHGQSSGAVLALRAAQRSSVITGLAVHEAPFIVNDRRPATGPEYHSGLVAQLDRGERGGAVRQFLEFVGLPKALIAGMRLTPLWPRLKAIAHTLPYDSLITLPYQQGDSLSPADWSGVDQKALIMSGGKSGAWIQDSMAQLAEILPEAEHHTLEGQTHHIRPKVVGPELLRFFLKESARRHTVSL